MHFDTNTLPALTTCRNNGYRNEYDPGEHVASVICLDSDRNTMNDSDQYAIIKKAYYADGKLHTEWFYDQDNTAAPPRNVQYGHLYTNGKPICINKDGNKYL